MTPGRLRAAIVGGGIGGLSAALSLRRHGVDVTVYEQAKALGEVGAGVFIFPNSLRHFERMGLGPAFAAAGGKVGPQSSYCRMDGTFVGKITTTDSQGWNGMYGMHRADLLRILAEALPSDAVRTDHRCIGVTQLEEGGRLIFANGAQAEADVIIGADGIQSVLQTHIVGASHPDYAGFRAYRGLVAIDDVPGWRREAHQVWMGDGKHFMVFPVRGGTLLNYVGFVPTRDQTVESWSAIGDRDELAAAFAGWDRPVVDLLAKVQTCFWWGLYDRAPLATWSKGALTLLGDAAHPMLPHLGQGANQAVEDGVALAVLLEGRDPRDVPDVLRRYETLRRARTDLVQAEARRNGERYDSKVASLAERDREIANAAIFRSWLYDYDVAAAAQETRDACLASA